MREGRNRAKKRGEEKKESGELGGTHEKTERRGKVVYTETVQAHSGTLVDMPSL